METGIQAIISQMTNAELDDVQAEILRIKDQRKNDELKQIVSEINSLLTKLQDFRDSISVDCWVHEFDNQFNADIELLDLIESLKELTY